MENGPFAKCRQTVGSIHQPFVRCRYNVSMETTPPPVQPSSRNVELLCFRFLAKRIGNRTRANILINHNVYVCCSPFTSQPLAPLEEHIVTAHSITIPQSVIESLRLSLLNSLIPWKSNPAEYRAEGSDCQVQGQRFVTSPDCHEKPGRSCDPNGKRTTSR